MKNDKLWFKAKRYGWGWYPIAWQGWVIILIYAVIMTKVVIWANNAAHSNSDFLIMLAPSFIIATGLLLLVCYKKGEKIF